MSAHHQLVVEAIPLMEDHAEKIMFKLDMANAMYVSELLPSDLDMYCSKLVLSFGSEEEKEEAMRIVFPACFEANHLLGGMCFLKSW